jgi:hypothetical protein
MPEYRYPDVETDTLFVCKDCGNGTFDQQVHTQWHADIADALLEHRQLKEELARADLAAAGNGVRADAAIRLADTVRDWLHTSSSVVVGPDVDAALELWEKVR